MLRAACVSVFSCYSNEPMKHDDEPKGRQYERVTLVATLGSIGLELSDIADAIDRGELPLNDGVSRLRRCASFALQVAASYPPKAAA